MVTKIQKWGNSQGLRISKEQLKKVFIRVGDEVEVDVKNGMIIIKPANHIRGKFSLKELTDRMPKKYQPYEEDWGIPVGKEIW